MGDMVWYEKEVEGRDEKRVKMKRGGMEGIQ